MICVVCVSVCAKRIFCTNITYPLFIFIENELFSHSLFRSFRIISTNLDRTTGAIGRIVGEGGGWRRSWKESVRGVCCLCETQVIHFPKRRTEDDDEGDGETIYMGV